MRVRLRSTIQCCFATVANLVEQKPSCSIKNGKASINDIGVFITLLLDGSLEIFIMNTNINEPAGQWNVYYGGQHELTKGFRNCAAAS